MSPFLIDGQIPAIGDTVFGLPGDVASESFQR